MVDGVLLLKILFEKRCDRERSNRTLSPVHSVLCLYADKSLARDYVLLPVTGAAGALKKCQNREWPSHAFSESPSRVNFSAVYMFSMCVCCIRAHACCRY